MNARSTIRDVAWAALSACLWLSGCAQIIGADERSLDASDGGDADAAEAGQDGSADGSTDAGSTPPSDECLEYCDTVMQNCTDEQAAYRNRDTCLAVCAELEVVGEDDPDGNSLACRLDEAKAAPAEPPFHCPGAAPGGAGRCGTDCESYCALYAQVCPDRALEGCERLCQGIPTRDGFDADRDFSAGSDTLQCRLAHLSAAALADPEAHCVHSQLVPTENSPCNLKADNGDAPSCEDYCKLETTVCTGELAVYESIEQCEKACESFEVGAIEDTNANSLGCRRYHSYAALIAPNAHCSHSGIGGDGHCGPLCTTYCELLSEGCPAELAAKFTDQDGCEQACLELTGGENGDVGYSVESGQQDGNTLDCRLFDLTRVLAGDTGRCEGAVGDGRCAP